MSRKIGISIASMVPWTLLQNGLGRGLLMAYEAGFDGLQLLPFRGWNRLTFPGMPLEKVISYENAWNCGSLFFALLRHLRLAGEECPLFHDWLLFGKCKVAKYRSELLAEYFPDALFIGHNLREANNPNTAIEINPEIKAGGDWVWEMCPGIVWDTEHIIRPGRHGEKPVTADGHWEELLEKISPNIRLIHVKSSVDPKMLKTLAAVTSCPVIFEDKPPLRNIFRSPLKDSRERMLSWLKDRRTFLGYFFE